MKVKYIVITFIILCIFAVIGNNTKNEEMKVDNKIISLPNGIQVISHEKKGIATIETIIKNNTGKELKSIKITAECYDKKNNNIGKATNGKYNVNTKDNHKIDLYCDSETERYNLYIEYEK